MALSIELLFPSIITRTFARCSNTHIPATLPARHPTRIRTARMPNKTGNDLFIVDNSDNDWKVLSYLREWSDISSRFDIATGYFEIGALLALDGKWQQLDGIRILMGDLCPMQVGVRNQDRRCYLSHGFFHPSLKAQSPEEEYGFVTVNSLFCVCVRLVFARFCFGSSL